MKSDNFALGVCICLIGLVLALPLPCLGGAFPITMIDGAQKTHRIMEKPGQVVCLVPYVTEMLVAFGQADTLAGLTRQDLILNAGLRKKNMGSYFQPNLEAIAGCSPDLIIAAPSQRLVIQSSLADHCTLIIMEAKTLDQAFSQMETMGKLFDCEKKAADTIQRNKEQLALVKARLANIPLRERKRVARVMAGTAITCPGDDSFQNEMIAAAGGIPPKWGKKGPAVPISPEQWQDFNPQVVYGCNKNKKAVDALLKQEGFTDVAAVQSGAVHMFPCDLTCRASTRVGAFVQWLATVLYLETFADPKKAVTADRVLDASPLALDLNYVEQARVVRHWVADAEYKSLVIRFKTPQNLLSTFEGYLTGVLGAGNTFVPMPASLGHMVHGVARVKEAIQKNLGFLPGEFATLMTGANMDNLAVVQKRFKDLAVTALVTAGVKGNAMRMSKDSGLYFSHGTINIIVMTNRRLSFNAMARSIITATEAKSAALLDMDIRSSYTPWDHRATGTGTDNVLVVQGQGAGVQFAGGHSKIGELIAKAVHAGVTQAVLKQNGLASDRDLFQRLADRKQSLQTIVQGFALTPNKKPSKKPDTKELIFQLENLLMDPYYANFIASALAISDDYEKGLIKEPVFFDEVCHSISARIANQKNLPPALLLSSDGLPQVMAKAFGALISGIQELNKATRL